MKASRRYLLDTNIVSALLREPQGAVAQPICRVVEQAVFTSIMVAGELGFGVAKRGSPRLLDQVDKILDAIDVQAFESPADEEYARLRLELETLGTPSGPNDLLIAAQALASSAVLVTANQREFERVTGLTVENWLASP